MDKKERVCAHEKYREMIGSEKLAAGRHSAMPGPINETTKQVWNTGVGDGAMKGRAVRTGDLEGMMSEGSQAHHGLTLC